MNIDLKVILSMFLGCFLLGAATLYIVSNPHSKPSHPVTSAYPTGKPDKQELGNQYDPNSETQIHLIKTTPRGANSFETQALSVQGLDHRKYKVKFEAKGINLVDHSANVSVFRDWHSLVAIVKGSSDWLVYEEKFIPDASSIEIRVILEAPGELFVRNISIEEVK